MINYFGDFTVPGHGQGAETYFSSQGGSYLMQFGFLCQ